MTVRVVDVVPGNVNHHYREIYKSLSFLNIFLNIFSINGNKEYTGYSKLFFYARNFVTLSVFGIVIAFGLYYKITYIYGYLNLSVAITDAVQITYDYCQYLVDLWIANKNRRDSRIKYFERYECIDKHLGITEYATVQRRSKAVVVIFLTIWLVSSVGDFLAWYFTYGWLTPTVYGVAYFYFLIKIFTTLDLSSHVMHIEARMKAIGDMVDDQYVAAGVVPESLRDINGKNWTPLNRKMSAISQLDSRLSSVNEDHKCLSKCYLLLLQQVDLINRMFGFRLFLNCLSLLIDIVRFTNILVRVILLAFFWLMWYFTAKRFTAKGQGLWKQLILFLLRFHLVSQVNVSEPQCYNSAN